MQDQNNFLRRSVAHNTSGTACCLSSRPYLRPRLCYSVESVCRLSLQLRKRPRHAKSRL